MTPANPFANFKWIADPEKGPGWYVNPASGQRKFEDLWNHRMTGEMKAVNQALRDAGLPEMWTVQASGQTWDVAANPDFKQPRITLGTGKDAAWALPQDFYGVGRPNDPQGVVNSVRLGQFTNWLSAADLNQLLDKFPEFREIADYYRPVADKFLQLRAEQGMPSYMVNVRTGQGANTPDEILEQWLRMAALQKGHAEFGTPVRTLEEIAPYLQLQGDRGLAPFLNHYAVESTSWLDQNLPLILGGLSLVGLNPLAVLGKGLGSVLGSNIAGQAAAGAALSAATGGDALQAALASLAGGAAGKLGQAANLGTAGQAASGALAAAAQGGNPLAAALGAVAQAHSAQNTQNNGGGSQTMGGFNWKDILLPAAAGALTNSSAPTGAAAGAVLGLLNANTGLLPQNTAGDLLAAAIQGYAQNKFQGAPGGAGAAQALGSALADKYLSGGTLDDKLRALLGIPDGAGAALQNLLPQGTDDILRQWLGNALGVGTPAASGSASASGHGSAPAAGAAAPPAVSPAPGPPAQAPPDLYSLYQQYYAQLPPGSTADFQQALDARQAAARAQLQDAFQQQLQGVNADLNRRGLFSSGLALEQQNALRAQQNNALAGAAADQALQIQAAREARDAERRQTAWDLAANAQKLFLQTPAPAAAAPAPASAAPAPAAPQAQDTPWWQSLLSGILDNVVKPRIMQDPVPAAATQQPAPQLSALNNLFTVPGLQSPAAVQYVPSAFTTRAVQPAGAGGAVTRSGGASSSPFSFSSGSTRTASPFTLSGSSTLSGARGKSRFSYLG